MLGYNKNECDFERILVNEEGLHRGPMVCAECALATIPKGGEIHKASYFSFFS
jgi:hypothetical protein